MKINWIIIGTIVVVLIALILFMIRKDQKEKKKFTKFLNDDFKKADEDEPDFEDTANEK
ncbi:FeoB-associated Cys-rich membrane protein [Flavobacterium sp. RS13.1]|uniref:FeoB-associated Cys-rich membrane protein n=1 Tax=Flavobacterium sp. RS13.1 TaxID=3400345 RepID=UPI003AAF68EF